MSSRDAEGGRKNIGAAKLESSCERLINPVLESVTVYMRL